jgi:hypothetical protein
MRPSCPAGCSQSGEEFSRPIVIGRKGRRLEVGLGYLSENQGLGRVTVLNCVKGIEKMPGENLKRLQI